jgi:hypothetical protein
MSSPPAMAQTNVAAFFIPCLVKPDRTRTTRRSQIENKSVKIIAPAWRATFAILSLLHKGSSDGNCFWGTCVAQDLRYVLLPAENDILPSPRLVGYLWEPHT